MYAVAFDRWDSSKNKNMHLRRREAAVNKQLIVVGVDGSPASHTGLCWALARAEDTGARVRAVRCWIPVVLKARGVAVTAKLVSSSLAEQQARAERELAQVVAAAWLWVPNAVGKVVLEQKVIRGSAGPTLVSEAAEAELLMVGHGHRLIDMAHRSVSWYCLRYAHCPVVVIPAAAATRRTLLTATRRGSDGHRAGLDGGWLGPAIGQPRGIAS
jgi:nucleotide-binding universal stress UspA family protein